MFGGCEGILHNNNFFQTTIFGCLVLILFAVPYLIPFVGQGQDLTFSSARSVFPVCSSLLIFLYFFVVIFRA